MTISIDPQEKWLYIATTDGWDKKVGFTCDLNGLKCSAVIARHKYGAVFIVSELLSGRKMFSSQINVFDLLSCDTKEKTLVLVEEKLERFAEMLSKSGMSMSGITGLANVALAEHVKKFGPMPPIEIMEDFK